MTDPRKFDAEGAALVAAPLSLQERLVAYAKVFALGLGAIIAAGTVAGILTPSTVRVAIGYTAVIVDAVMVLAGGANGGGYANLGFGLIDRMADAAKRDRAEPEQPTGRLSRKYNVEDARPRRDPMERLRKGLRPEKNPTAFWTVVGGFAYVVIGSMLVVA